MYALIVCLILGEIYFQVIIGPKNGGIHRPIKGTKLGKHCSYCDDLLFNIAREQVINR